MVSGCRTSMSEFERMRMQNKKYHLIGYFHSLKLAEREHVEFDEKKMDTEISAN